MANKGYSLLVLSRGEVSSYSLLEGAEYVFGRRTSNSNPAVSVPDAFVSRRHGRFVCERGVQYQDLNSGNGTYINGTLMQGGAAGAPAALTPGDRIEVRGNDRNGIPGRVMIWLLDMEIKGAFNRFDISGRSEISIGRSRQKSDIVLDSAFVSRRHGVIYTENGRYYFRDSGSKSGSRIGGEPVMGSVPLSDGSLITMADCAVIFTSGAVFYSSPKAPDIGRVQDGSTGGSSRPVSGRHRAQPAPAVAAPAYLHPAQGGMPAPPNAPAPNVPVPNVSAPNGPVPKGPVPNGPVPGGQAQFRGYGQQAPPQNYGGPPRQDMPFGQGSGGPGRDILRANIVTKRVPSNTGRGEKELIRDVRLSVKEGSLVALLGSSGAGKTTVMNCLNGMDVKGVRGQVLFYDDDLMKNFDRLKYMIGSVPQREVFHEMLTVEEELREAAIIRLPRGTGRREIKAHVDRAVRQLNLENVRKNQLSKCSGGEKRRVNIAIELVAERQLLCLDEPDAGLDPGMKRELFTILRNLAHNEKKSILVIIHDVSEMQLFDQVVIMAKLNDTGRLAFSGSPQDAERYFGCPLKDVYNLLSQHPERYIAP